MKQNPQQTKRIIELERQLELIKQAAAVTPGNLQNQIDGMALLMMSVAQTLKLPADQTMKDLPAWATQQMDKMRP